MSKISEWLAIALTLSNNLVAPWTAKIAEYAQPLVEKVMKRLTPLMEKIEA
jgi:hypothetical protein